MRKLAFRQNNAPRHRLRGARRYFAKVQREAEEFDPWSSSDDWWDFWHYHADWPGWGNRGWRYRRSHLAALATVFKTICNGAHRFSTPFQTWIVIDGEDAGQDATFLHTPNPNGTEFPMTLTEAEWGVSELQPVMEQLLPGLDLEVGWTRTKYGDDDASWTTAHWIYARGVGIPIRAG